MEEMGGDGRLGVLNVNSPWIGSIRQRRCWFASSLQISLPLSGSLNNLHKTMLDYDWNSRRWDFISEYPTVFLASTLGFMPKSVASTQGQGVSR